jgi:aldehyde reductase
MEQATEPILAKTVQLSNGAFMPMIGLGTFQLMDKAAITSAIVKVGYRHLDTAWLYKNETLIGEALKDVWTQSEGKIKREDIFITTKIWHTQYENPEKELRGSLERLGVNYVDLYLIHWPAQYFNASKKPLHKLWAELEACVDLGLTRAIGLSNFNVQLTCDLLCYAQHRPVANQIELHPYCAQSELVRFLIDQHIVPIAYCPLGRPQAAETPGNQAADLKYTQIPDLR